MDIVILVVLIVLVVLVLYLINSIREVNINKSTSNESSVNLDKLEVNYQNIVNDLRKLSDSNISNDVLLKSIDNQLSSMSKVMINKKYRGDWGEYQLNNLLSVYFGNNKKSFKVQYKLSNGCICDVAMSLPGTDSILAIDSKFPYENYNSMINNDVGSEEYKKHYKLLKGDIKKHINDISSKYINSDTVGCAVMFLPSEAIYEFICSEMSDIIVESNSLNVMITSPTTLIGLVFTIVNITKDFNRAKNIKNIEKDIKVIIEDSSRLNDRVNKVDSVYNNLGKALRDVKISSDKVYSRACKINDSSYTETE